MNDWFSWNGTRCTEYGIHALNQPDIVRPAERVSTEKVFGQSGTLTKLEGEAVFDEFVAPVECIIRDTSRLREINAWLHGDGKIAFANRTGGFFYARVVNQIEFAKILRGNPHRSFTINFRCQPFFYHDEAPAITLLESGAFIVNPGTAASEPAITITGSGDITLMIGQYIIELEGVDGASIASIVDIAETVMLGRTCSITTYSSKRYASNSFYASSTDNARVFLNLTDKVARATFGTGHSNQTSYIEILYTKK